MKRIIKIVLIASIAFNLVSCEHDSTSPSSGSLNTGDVSVEFLNNVGNYYLDATGATNYTNSSGEQFSVTNFKYYVSNVKLIKEDGTKHEIPNSYYLINANDTNSLKIVLPAIPGGRYTGIEYLIGVDSARNVSGAHTGALDPTTSGMFWSWLGYTFMKLEGQSPASSSNSFSFHIGGYAGKFNGLRSTVIDFTPSVLIVDGGKREAEIHIKTDILEIFKNPNTISIAISPNVMSIDSASSNMATNYMDMFSFDHIHNDPL